MSGDILALPAADKPGDNLLRAAGLAQSMMHGPLEDLSSTAMQGYVLAPGLHGPGVLCGMGGLSMAGVGRGAGGASGRQAGDMYCTQPPVQPEIKK